MVGEAQGDGTSNHEAAISVDEDTNNGRGAQSQVQDERSSSGGSRSGKNQKKKFDISLPAQHLVSNHVYA